ncbi:hypothetical protein JVT61DRAFT_13773 [Boletus reticuloceps]|uniref:Letm1 RBD domain-containing protein n=1 Tax=Boletus reticuloceps TaxID=495285 RepID=A0A8I2YTW9_9AGAM|nr:hypothetical protein JVT61DRAFT_13773 [Boletus reticuloceps]
MLRSAGRNAALNRSNFISSNVPSLMPGALRLPRYALAHQVVYLRLASTVTPKSATAQPTDRNVPPPNPPRAAKKIDLKPGPVKPSRLDSIPSRRPLQDSTSLSYYRPPRHNTPPNVLEPRSTRWRLRNRTSTLQLNVAYWSQPPMMLPPLSGSPIKLSSSCLQKFYFRGLKSINTHRKQAAAIAARARSGGALPSRTEQRFIGMYRRDVLKLIPFVVIVTIAEELIPFIALYAPGMLPSTCILPGQRDRIASRARNKQLIALLNHRSVFEAICKEAKQSGFVPVQKISNPGAVCSILGLPAWGPSALTAWRIRRHLNTVAMDDERLRHEGCGRHLTIPELEEALVERGMIPESDYPSVDAMRAHLNWWLDNAEVLPEGANLVSRRLLMLGLIGSQK